VVAALRVLCGPTDTFIYSSSVTSFRQLRLEIGIEV
jgi:hypothetical protein